MLHDPPCPRQTSATMPFSKFLFGEIANSWWIISFIQATTNPNIWYVFFQRQREHVDAGSWNNMTASTTVKNTNIQFVWPWCVLFKNPQTWKCIDLHFLKNIRQSLKMKKLGQSGSNISVWVHVRGSLGKGHATMNNCQSVAEISPFSVLMWVTFVSLEEIAMLFLCRLFIKCMTWPTFVSHGLVMFKVLNWRYFNRSNTMASVKRN